MSARERPLIADPIATAWRCQHRLHCCRGWDVPVTEREHARILESLRTSWPIASMLDEAREDRWRLPLTDCGDCAMLEGQLCGYRVRFGAETQPEACRVFPYISLITPPRHILGLDFTCPTALDLLRTSGGLAPEVNANAEPPIPFVVDFVHARHWDVDGAPLTSEDFWARQWEWLDVYRGATGAGLAPLRAVVEAAVGARPRVEVEGVDWAATSLPAPLFGPLLQHGGNPLMAAGLFGPSPTKADVDELVEDVAGPSLLRRYLAHRLMAPGFLRRGAHLGRLLAVLAALAVRWHVERARGAGPLAATRRTELFFLHGGHMVWLFGRDDEGVDWKTPSTLLAALDALE